MQRSRLLGEAAPESVTDRIGEETWVGGMRLLPGVWVVPHWDALGDDVRSYFLSRIPASGIALGIDEATMLVRRPDAWGVHGRGGIFVRTDGVECRFGEGELPSGILPPVSRAG